MKKLLLIVPIALTLAGCETAVKNGDIVGIQSRVFGINIAASGATSTATPAIQLGLISQTVWMIPASTNKMYSPPMAATLVVNQSAWNPFSFDWNENLGVDDVQINNGTNVVSVPVIPKLAPPPLPQLKRLTK
jgi:hypothetical protein